ncbi:hypothetical protein WDU94_008751 [Cyamophila willieti]
MSTLLLKAILILGIVGMIASKDSKYSDPCVGTTPHDRNNWSDGIHYVLNSSVGFEKFKEFLDTRPALKSQNLTVSSLESLKKNFDSEFYDEKVKTVYEKFKLVLNCSNSNSN